MVANPDQDDLIDEHVILRMAQNIDQDGIYQKIFEMYEIECDDVQLMMKQMKFKFQEDEPVDKEFNEYFECLSEAHNQLLFRIQDPRNRYQLMQENPLDSKDLMHGVPSIFRELLDEIIDLIKNPIQQEAEVTVEEFDDEQFKDEEFKRDEQIMFRDNEKITSFQESEQSEDFFKQVNKNAQKRLTMGGKQKKKSFVLTIDSNEEEESITRIERESDAKNKILMGLKQSFMSGTSSLLVPQNLTVIKRRTT